MNFLLSSQNSDGTWGGDRGVSGTIEETALAVEALTEWTADEMVCEACSRGCDYLAEHVMCGGLARSAPIGLYFAELWYSEKLYPAIWTVGALGSFLSCSSGDGGWG